MMTNAAAPLKRANEISKSRHMVRLRNRKDGTYLHLSGKSSVPSVDGSWLGFTHQARTLFLQAEARGEAFPYDIVPRGALELALQTAA